MNLTNELVKEAKELLDLIDWAIQDLNQFSVDNDDVFNWETSKMQDEVRMARTQLEDHEQKLYDAMPNMSYELNT
jgi:hypothetical protein